LDHLTHRAGHSGDTSHDRTLTKKQPYYFQLKDGQPFAFAGLWERWHREGHDELLSCALITTTPNDVVGQVHDRMPVILPLAIYE
jgi:putative SOS response-associated peptidase YedK